jgi:3-oxoacyl-[acyl-carrier-protein] synthase-3
MKLLLKNLKITGIEERRYAKHNYNTSDLAFFAAKKQLKDAKINPETLNYIIVST